MKRIFVTTCIVSVWAVPSVALAVSDGEYASAKQHCSGAVDNSSTPSRTEPGCHSATLTVSDVGGHEYFGIGTQQEPEGHGGTDLALVTVNKDTMGHVIDVWSDLGDGCSNVTVDPYTTSVSPPNQSGGCTWWNRKTSPNPHYRPNPKPDLASGITIYFGADDNLDSGEHDSSHYVNNGPSDGGAGHFTLNPKTLGPWVAAIASGNWNGLATHPLPVADGGTGFCADGICFSIQTQRQVAYQGGSKTAPSRNVADYAGKTWDPYNCAGPSDTAGDCGGQDLGWWYRQDGTTYAQPGIQVYEDPDPQGSPAEPLYPIPALYVGTCGVVIGGGAPAFSDSGFPMEPLPANAFEAPPGTPFRNSAGQIVLQTADCTARAKATADGDDGRKRGKGDSSGYDPSGAEVHSSGGCSTAAGVSSSGLGWAAAFAAGIAITARRRRRA